MKKLCGFLVVFSWMFCSLQGAYIGYVYPAGAKAGSTVEVLFGGQGLWGVRNIRVTGGGVKLKKISRVPGGLPNPGSAAQRNFLVYYLKNIEAGHPENIPPKPNDTRDWRKNEYWEKLDKLSPLQLELVERALFIRRDPLQDSPAIKNQIVAVLEIDADAKPGRREIRLVGVNVTNPLPFYISRVDEVKEPRFVMPPAHAVKETVFSGIANLNGQIMPGETDYFSFYAAKDEKMHFIGRGRELAPFLGDGVPGHFQMVLEIRNGAGRCVAYSDDYFFNPDPVLNFKAPENGVYTLAVRDALYRGRADFVYRVERRNDFAPGFVIPDLGKEYKLKVYKHRFSNKPIEVKRLPKLFFSRFAGSVKEQDYRLTLKKGEPVVLEILARRIGSPADCYLKLTDESGKVLAMSDDLKDLRAGLTYHQADCRIEFTAPSDGVYIAKVGELIRANGGNYFYYFRASAPKPALDVWVTPSAISLYNKFGISLCNVTVVRKEGLSGEVEFAVPEDAPYELTGVNSLPANCSRGVLTLMAKQGKRFRNIKIGNFELSAKCNGVAARVRGGDEAMQAFAYTHIIPAAEMLFYPAWSTAPASQRCFWKGGDVQHLKVDSGKSTEVAVKFIGKHPEDKFALNLVDAPNGISVSEAVVTDDGFTVKLTAGEKAVKGDYNLLFQAVYTPALSDKNKNDKNKPKKSQGAVQKFYLPVVRLVVK